jgi:hypothetical protein
MAATAVAAEPRSATAVRETLFIRMWSVAALAHVIGNGHQGDLLPVQDAGGVALAAVSVAALAALLRPSRPAMAVLAVAIIASAVIDVPLLSNHWTLAALVSLAYLLSGARWNGFEPAARLVLLVVYSFAAFAKVNEGFLDPSVSCSIFYANQTLTSAGLPALSPDGSLAAVLPWLVVVTELAVPVLLVLRRTRWAGVLLAATFHTAISLDLGQHFYDFTAVLLALFVLFLPEEWSRSAVDRIRRTPAPLRGVGTGIGLTIVVALAVVALLPSGAFGPALPLLAFVVWVPYALVVIGLVALGPRTSAGLSWRPAAAAWLAVVLAFVNGLTPWTETKTAFGYTMYSNVEAAQGRTNHLVVPATLPLRDDLNRLVAVESSTDTGLEYYADSGWLLPWPSLVLYLQNRAATEVTYRDGVALDGTGGEPVTATGWEVVDSHGPVPWWWAWMPLRSVDAQSPPRCQDVWLPAL